MVECKTGYGERFKRFLKVIGCDFPCVVYVSGLYLQTIVVLGLLKEDQV